MGKPRAQEGSLPREAEQCRINMRESYRVHGTRSGPVYAMEQGQDLDRLGNRWGLSMCLTGQRLHSCVTWMGQCALHDRQCVHAL